MNPSLVRLLNILFIAIFLAPSVIMAQSKTTDMLQSKYKDSFSLFFYNNTLRMLNQAEDPEFDEIIKDIEKMKFLMINKTQGGFQYNELVSDYKKEAFEEAMTSRHQGKNFDVYLKANGGKTKAMLVLINDAENLYVLDILGSIALDKITKFYSVMDKNTDIAGKIETFVHKHGDNDEEGEKKD